MSTATQTASLLRAVIKDYNYWPSSEADSPLKIGTRKGVLTDTKLLAIDARYRRRDNEDNPDYQLPDRQITVKPLHQTFKEIIDASISNLTATKANYDNHPETLPNLEMAAESVEFGVQLYSVFQGLTNPVIQEISTPGESTVTLVISGEIGEGDELRSVYATSTLVHT
jgi:hypothetical protein